MYETADLQADTGTKRIDKERRSKNAVGQGNE